jgi:hypothetical protein
LKFVTLDFFARKKGKPWQPLALVVEFGGLTEEDIIAFLQALGG